MVAYIRSDLEFILAQIKISEDGAICGGPDRPVREATVWHRPSWTSCFHFHPTIWRGVRTVEWDIQTISNIQLGGRQFYRIP